jgi:polyhydroxybutyrate depolymerase
MELHRLEWGGCERTYGVHSGLARDGAPRPAVLVLHGGGTNAELAERMSGMSEKADAEGFIAVYPNGSGLRPNANLTWNAGHCCGFAHRQGINDSSFLSELIRVLPERHGADPERIYVTGFSNGAMMAHRLACEAAASVAAMAGVAGTAPLAGLSPARPVAVLMFHGTEDRHALYAGGSGENSLYPRIDPPVHEMALYWARANGCTAIPETDERGRVLRETWSGGREGSEVTLYTIRGQGHAWPGGRPGIRYGNIDEPCAEISATDTMWKFFQRHTRRRVSARP